MDTDEAWESFIGIRKSSAKGYVDTIAAALNNIETNTSNLTKLTNRLLGDQAMLDNAPQDAQSVTEDVAGAVPSTGGDEMAGEDQDKNALDEALGIIDEQVAGGAPAGGEGAVPPAPAEGGPEEGTEPAPDGTVAEAAVVAEGPEGMGVPPEDALPQPEANFNTKCIQFSEEAKKELQSVAGAGDYYKARRLIELITTIDKIIDSDGDPSTVLKSASMEKSEDESLVEHRAMRTPVGRARAVEGLKGNSISTASPDKSRLMTKEEAGDAWDTSKGQYLSEEMGRARGALNPDEAKMSPDHREERQSRNGSPNRSGLEPIPGSDWELGDEHDTYEGITYMDKSEDGPVAESESVPEDSISKSSEEADPVPMPAPKKSEGERKSIPVPEVDMEKSDDGAAEASEASGPTADTGMAGATADDSVASSCSVKKSIPSVLPSIKDLMRHRQGGEEDPYAEFAKSAREGVQYDMDHNESFQKSTSEKALPFAELMAKFRKG